MNSNEVIVHNDRIQNLICGTQQHVGSTMNKQKSDLSTFKNNTDYSNYPFPDPIEPSKFNEQGMNSRESNNSSSGFDPKSKMREFNKLKSEESMIKNVDHYLSMYDINSKRKKMLLHQDLENHYFQPLSTKLSQKTCGKDYEKYLKAKSRAISAFDTQTRTNDTFSKELPKIPTLKCDLSDLTDPVVKYRVNAREEKKLTRLIQKSTGEIQETKKLPERDTLNLKKYKILTETRFFDGNVDSNSPNAPINSNKGKKIFPGKFDSQITPYVDNFTKPLDRPVVLQRKRIDYQVDHINFDQ